jgi:3-dehydroquinate synthase
MKNLIDKILTIETKHLIIITNETIYHHYLGDSFFQCLKNKTFEWTLWIGPDGEEIKQLHHYERCLQDLLQSPINRQSHLLAIGGGSVSDFAGFVAATLFRGLKWSVVPTTLLAMVDASIGGKVGLNLKEGKNLIGAFHLPENIFIEEKFLQSLSYKEWQSGWGEIVKYGFLHTPIWDLIQEKPQSGMGPIIKACIDFKNAIVNEDLSERQNGPRQLLNLGHTFGHALEKTFQLEHGMAVFLGLEMIIDFQLYLNKENHQKIFQELKQRCFPDLNLHYLQLLNDKNNDEFLSYCLKDKKRQDQGTVRFIFIKNIADVYFEDVNLNVVKQFIREKIHG